MKTIITIVILGVAAYLAWTHRDTIKAAIVAIIAKIKGQ